MNENLLAIKASIMELTHWVEQQCGAEVVENIRGALDTLDQNEGSSS